MNSVFFFFFFLATLYIPFFFSYSQKKGEEKKHVIRNYLDIIYLYSRFLRYSYSNINAGVSLKDFFFSVLSFHRLGTSTLPFLNINKIVLDNNNNTIQHSNDFSWNRKLHRNQLKKNHHTV